MLNANTYKPRYKLAGKVKSNIWPYKNGRLRGIVLIRKRRRRRGGHYRRLFMVHKTMKWTEARRFFRYSMFDRKIRKRNGRARRRSYRENFNIKQKFRNFYGKITESNFRNIFQHSQRSSSKLSYSFYATLESRLETIIYRLRYVPRIFAANQLIHHHGVEVNQRISKNPRYKLLPGDVVAPLQNQWKIFCVNLTRQVFYREWGLYVRKRRYVRRYLKYRSKLSAFKPRWNKVFRKYFNNNKKLLVYITKIRPFVFSKRYNSASFSNKSSDFYIIYKNFLRNFASHITGQAGQIRDKKYNKYYTPSSFFKQFPSTKKKNFFYSKAISEIFSPVYNMGHNLKKESILFKNKKAEKKASLYTYKNRFYQGKSVFLLMKWLNEFFKRHPSNNPTISHLRKKIDHYFASVFRSQIIQWKMPRKRLFYGYFVSLWRKRRKNRRFKKLSRLRKVHWYIPAYLYFDPATFRGTLIRIPRSEEIIYPTHLSPHSVYSFYRSRGF